MLLKLSEAPNENTLYVSDEHIVALTEDMFMGDKVYLLYLAHSLPRRITQESYEAIVKILGWFDPSSIEKTEAIVRENLDLVESTPAKKCYYCRKEIKEDEIFHRDVGSRKGPAHVACRDKFLNNGKVKS